MGAPQFDQNATYTIQQALQQLESINGKPLTDQQKSDLATKVLGRQVDANDTSTTITGAQMANAASIVQGYGNAKPDYLTPPNTTTTTPPPPGGGDWWTQNSPQFTTPGPYTTPQWGGSFSAPALPSSLSNQYALPSASDLENMPGFQVARDLGQQGIERSAAAKGTVLNPGTVQALSEFNNQYAQTGYGNLVNEQLAARNQNLGEYNNTFDKAFQQYAQKYGEFVNSSNMGLSGYQTNVTNQRNSQNDYWNELLGLSNQGITSNGQIAGA